MKEYTIQEVITALKNGELTVDFGGHTFNEGNVEEVIEVLERQVEWFNDNRDLFKNNLNSKYGVDYTLNGEPIPLDGYTSGHEYFCWGCGYRHKLVFVEETVLGFMSTRNTGRKQKTPSGHSFPIFEKNTEPCEFPYGEYEKFQGVINIPSGKVLVANWFSESHDDNYNDPIYNPRGFGLQSNREQFELMEHLIEEKNVFYGQTGNTSGTVFGNKNEIVMCDEYCYTSDEELAKQSYIDDDMLDDWEDGAKDFGKWEMEYKPTGMKEVGSVSMDVWRYMITDHQQAVDGNYKISSEHVVVKVKPGKYKVEHLYYNRDLKPTHYFKMKKI